MEQGLAFVVEWLKHECSMAELCRGFSISRQTGYELVAYCRLRPRWSTGRLAIAAHRPGFLTRVAPMRSGGLTRDSQGMSSTAASTTAPETANWSVWHIDPAHSLVEFGVRHMMVSTVRGRFTGLLGTI